MDETEYENKKLKKELYSLYMITIENNNSSTNISSDISNKSSYTNLSLINDIKKSIIEITSKNKKYKENLLQFENIIKKLEIDIKYYLKNLLHYKIQNNSLEIKLNSFLSMEEEYEELKEKLKYEGGKFLDNDRKDNEIMILRNENSKIKKEIVKLENRKKLLETEIIELKYKINELENNFENLKKKNLNLEKNMKLNHHFNSIIHIKTDNKDNKDIIINKKFKRNNFSLSNFQNIINFTNNNNHNNKKRKLINFQIPKEDLIYIDHSRNNFNNNNNKTSLNSILLTATYNKLTNEKDNKKNKLLFELKKDYKVIKYTRNNSLSAMKLRDFSGNKTMPFNNNYIYKSDYKQKSFNKIINTKQINQSNAFSLNKKNINKNLNRITSEKNIKKSKI